MNSRVMRGVRLTCVIYCLLPGNYAADALHCISTFMDRLLKPQWNFLVCFFFVIHEAAQIHPDINHIFLIFIQIHFQPCYATRLACLCWQILAALDCCDYLEQGPKTPKD